MSKSNFECVVMFKCEQPMVAQERICKTSELLLESSGSHSTFEYKG